MESASALTGDRESEPSAAGGPKESASTSAVGAYRPGYERVAGQVLQLIAESQLQPGDRMPTENALAERLGTSRTAVREAVKILSALGRVRAHKGRGLYVADDEGMLGLSRWGGFFLPTDLDHIYMLFEFRRLQEMEASRLAAGRATPAELRAIEEAAETCNQGHLTDQAPLFDQGDDDFHISVATASHNGFLVAAVREARRLQRQSSTIGLRGVIGDHAAGAITEHAAIFRAIRDGNPEAAAQAAATHLDNTLEQYQRDIKRRLFG
jgi:GntR family transcriptional repressor for pyruvate dehydrogenase complex